MKKTLLYIHHALREARWTDAARALLIVVLLCSFMWLPSGCDHSDIWNDVPPKIQTFIVRYFPSFSVSSCDNTASGYHVRLANGPGLSFDVDYDWTNVNGYGMPLPEVLLFDQLPPKVYSYLQATDDTDGVFEISRDSLQYRIELLNSTLSYTIATDSLNGE